MIAATPMFSIAAILLLLVGGGVTIVLGTIILVRVGGAILTAVGTVFGRIFEFIGGIVGDAARLIGALLAAVVFIPLALVNVVIGRWSAANHFADAFRREIGILGGRAWSIAVRRPLRLLFLEGMLEGVEQRAADAVVQAPGPDLPRNGGEFPGFEVTGSLPSGGSGARLFIARPDEKTRRRLLGEPEEVVIKSFALAEGSSLPQIVRESRSLDAARRLGLVLAHELNESRFWYAMPYHPGDNLSVVVRHAHGFADEKGLDRAELDRLIGYGLDLVRTLDRYHLAGMWHKDVKPDNIIVHDGAAHLVDFGLVSSLKSAMTLTTHGTEYFRDPEMVRMAMDGVKVHEVNGAKFDLFGAGAVLYFMLENTFPAHGGLSRFERPSPEALRMIVRRAMADYHHRYENAAEMLADLEYVAVAADPWAVKPAQLPSLGGEPMAAAPASPPTDVASVIPPRRTTPPPPVVVQTGTSGGSRPAIRVTGWWTGSYQSSDGGRPRARVQVANARSRAAHRRRSVTPPGRRPVSAMLALLVMGVISAVVGAALTFGWSGARSVDTTTNETSIVARELATWRDLLKKPAGIDRPRVIVLDDQGGLDESSAIRLADDVRTELESEGWVVADDSESEARVRAMPGISRLSWSTEEAEASGFDVVFWIRSGDIGNGEPETRLARLIRIVPGQTREIEVDVVRPRVDRVPEGPEATATVEVEGMDRLIRIEMERAFERSFGEAGEGSTLGASWGRPGARLSYVEATSQAIAVASGHRLHLN